MSSRRAWVLVAGVCLLTAGVPAGVAAAEIPDKHLPDDSEMVYGFNIRSILGAEVMKNDGTNLVKTLFQKSPTGGWLELLKLDPLQDVDSVMVAESKVTAEKPGGPQVYDSLILLSGKFDQEKLKKTLDDVGAKLDPQEHAKVKIYQRKQGDGPKLFAAFLNEDLLAIGNKKALVETAIDKEQGNKKTELKSKDLRAAMEWADSRRAIWLAAAMPGLLRDNIGTRPDERPVSNYLTVMVCSATFKKDMLFQCDMQCGDLEDLAYVKRRLERTKGDLERFVKGNKKYRKLWESVFQEMRISHKHDVITVRLEIRPEFAPKFIEMFADSR